MHEIQGHLVKSFLLETSKFVLNVTRQFHIERDTNTTFQIEWNDKSMT